MASWSLNELHEALRMAMGSEPPPTGVGVRAFPRMGPGLFLEGYRGLCFSHTNDLSEIRALFPVDCLNERTPSLSPLCRDTLSLLSHPVLERIGHMPEAGTRMVVYQQTPELEELARRRQWRFLASSSNIRLRWQNKAWFRSRLNESGLAVAPWIETKIEDFTPKNYQTWRQRWGSKMVVQIPDFPRGGGRGTFFIEDETEVEILRKRWQTRGHRGHLFQEVMVSPWIEGPSVSAEGCVTRWGILQSPLQTQLLDLDDVLPPGHGGRFCGHQWGVPIYPPGVEGNARAAVQWVGTALLAEGYLGIFGLDFALDAQSGRLYVLECNPRYTGAFPALTLLQMAQGVLPIEAFHIITWLDPTIPLPSEVIKQTGVALPCASQILLFPRGDTPAEISANLKAGRYFWSHSKGEAQQVGRAMPLIAQPWNPDEFIIVDGPPSPGTKLFPPEDMQPILRIIFLKAVLESDGSLDPVTKRVIEWIYDKLGLRKTPTKT